MSAEKQSAIRKQWISLLERLESPFALRSAILGGLALVGVLGSGTIFLTRIGTLEDALTQQRERKEILRNISQAQRKTRMYAKLVPKEADMHWWITYLLGGSRQARLRVLEYKPRMPTAASSKIGNYQGVYLQLSTSGRLQSVLDYLLWLEYNKYSCRLVRLRIKKQLGTDAIDGDFTVAVLTTKSAKKTEAADKSDAADKVDKSDKPEKPEKSDKPEKTDG